MKTTYSLRNSQTHTLFEISNSDFSIGRSEHCDVCINDTDVSRDHAKITKSVSRLVITDLGSRNGTRINGRKIVGPTELAPGDTIQIGHDSFTLEVEGTAESTVYAKTPIHAAIPAESGEVHRFRFSDLLHLFPRTEHVSYTENIVEFSSPETQATIQKYLNYFTYRLEAHSGLSLFFFKEGKPLAIHCVTPSSSQTEWTIGRGDANYIRVEDPSVSKRHAKIAYVGSSWILTDQSSTNGLRFNDRREIQMGLTDGMTVNLGDIILYVRMLYSKQA